MSAHDDRLDFLREVPVFAGAGPAALQELAGLAVEVTIPSGGIIVREGDPGAELYLVQSGSVEIVKHLDEPHESSLARLGPGDCFGEMALLERMERSASVRARKRSVLLRIGADDLHLLAERWPADYATVVLNIARSLSRRLRALDENWAEASRHRSLDEALIRALEA